MNSSNQNLISATVLALGLTAAAWTLGSQLDRVRETGVITVKGLAEAEYKASMGTWRIGVATWGADYASALAAQKSALAKVNQFLKNQGFSQEQLQLEEINVSAHEEMFTDDNGREHTRQNGYDAERYYIVSTKELPKLQKAVQAVQKLRSDHESVRFSPPKYYLEELESIKRKLISQATQDALVRAEKFAKTGKMKVGAMKSASQGSFDIQSTTPSDDVNSDYGGGYDTTTIDKKVRLVVTIQYQIND